jgi:hypothetical protein
MSERNGEGQHGSFLWLDLPGGGGEGDVILVEGVDRVKGGGRASPTHTKLGRNTIMTECRQESVHRQSVYSLVCGICHRLFLPIKLVLADS